MPRPTRRTPGTLEGRTVVITGAGSGIGRALALETARRGARLALSDIDLAGLATTADLVVRATARAPRTDRLDVRDREAWEEYAAEVADDLGAVHVLVNNAGVALTGDLVDLSHEQIQLVVDVDLWGVVHGTRVFLPHLIGSGEGRLVNVSSLFGLMAVPGQSAYNAAKYAVRGFTEAVSQEMLAAGHPVTVTCVHPGGVRTAIARNAAAGRGQEAAAQADHFDRNLARTSPERAARVIVDGMLAGRARVLVGADAKVLDVLVRVAGPAYPRILTAALRRSAARRARS